jgi:hypothetical protein
MLITELRAGIHKLSYLRKHFATFVKTAQSCGLNLRMIISVFQTTAFLCKEVKLKVVKISITANTRFETTAKNHNYL